MGRRIIDDPNPTAVCRIPPTASVGEFSKPSRFTKRNLGILLFVVGMFNFIVMIAGILLLVASTEIKYDWIIHQSRQRVGIFLICGILLSILAWSPWISEQYAIDAVVDNLGGPNATFNYLGTNVTIEEIPIDVVTAPFFRLVYFPGEAMFIVPFWGGVFAPSLGLDSAGD